MDIVLDCIGIVIDFVVFIIIICVKTIVVDTHVDVVNMIVLAAIIAGVIVVVIVFEFAIVSVIVIVIVSVSIVDIGYC